MRKVLLVLLVLSMVCPVSALATDATPSPEEALTILEEENAALKAKVAELEARIAELGTSAYVELKDGAKGGEVENLQSRLKELGYYDGDITGKYDSKTQKAVRAFQELAGLPSSSRATIQLQEALFGSAAPTPAPTPTPKPTYKKIAYDKLARNPDDYDGELVLVTGRVVQVLENSISINLRIATRGRYNDVVYITYFGTSEDLGQRILEGDSVTIEGMSDGILSYKAINGATISIPSVIADAISIKKKK